MAHESCLIMALSVVTILLIMKMISQCSGNLSSGVVGKTEFFSYKKEGTYFDKYNPDYREDLS